MSLPRIPIDSYTYWIHLHTKFSIFSLPQRKKKPQPPYRFSSWSDLDKIFICTRSIQPAKEANLETLGASSTLPSSRDFIPLGQYRNRLWGKHGRKFIRVWSPRATINWKGLTVCGGCSRCDGVAFSFDLVPWIGEELVGSDVHERFLY